MNAELPSFNDPPVVEVAVSVMFKPIENLGNADLGVFWHTMRDSFPVKEDAEPILNQTEQFGKDVQRVPRLPTIKLKTARGASRLLMTNGNQMVQVQNSRLAYNWRTIPGDTSPYPRWRVVYPAFESARAAFANFLNVHGIGAMEPNQWEVAYVNHLVRGRDWETPSDWHRLLPGIVGTGVELGTMGAEAIECSYHFTLPGNRCRLHVDMHHGFTAPEADATEVLAMQLTARGPVVGGDFGLAAGLNLGHETIVSNFANITGSQAHARWGRQL